MGKQKKATQKLMKKDQRPLADKEKGTPAFFKYMGLSFQLFATIGLGTYLGWWIQQQSKMKFPIWILLFCFFSVFIAFYHLWISIKKDQ